MNGKTLPPKQQAFVREYLIDLDASKSVVRAGYHATGQRAAEIGYQLLQKTPVKSAIQAAMDERAKRVEVSSDYVLRNLIEVSERCLQRAPVFEGKGKDRKQATEFVVDPDTGEEVLANVWQFDAQGVLRANELIGKNLKMFTDKTEISGPDGGPVTLNILPVKAPTNDSQIKNTPEIGNSSQHL